MFYTFTIHLLPFLHCSSVTVWGSEPVYTFAARISVCCFHSCILAVCFCIPQRRAQLKQQIWTLAPPELDLFSLGVSQMEHLPAFILHFRLRFRSEMIGVRRSRVAL